MSNPEDTSSANPSSSKEKDCNHKIISCKPPVIVSELAEEMEIQPFQLIADLIKMQIFVRPNQAIEPEVAAKLCEFHGFVFEREKRDKKSGVQKKEEIQDPEKIEEFQEEGELRPPIITFMGHVDHGKTSLLDYIRKTHIAKGEAGGITQHIAAYHILHNNKPVTFIDTPGHAIFAKMRSRGADITDIVVLVVAADDGVMPQTKEAIDHVRAANKTLVVAINKSDLPGANPMQVKSQLMEENVMTVDLGGNVEVVEVSAQTGKGIDELLDLLILQSDVLELKANVSSIARAIVIEAKMQTGLGPGATLVMKNGTLRSGDSFICGKTFGKVKSLISDSGERLEEAKPGMPIGIIGFENLPDVGDDLVVMEKGQDAKKLGGLRKEKEKKEKLQSSQKNRMEDLMALFDSETKDKVCLDLLLKGDAQGSIEAIREAIEDLHSEKVEVNFIRVATGPISESDVLLASSSNAVIVGFNIKLESKAVKIAKSEGVQVKLFSIVYELIDTIKEAMLGMLEPESRETTIGKAEVKEIFSLKKGKAAGCVITEGHISRTANARVLRGDQSVYDGKMSTLRRFKDEVEEVKTGVECGIRLGNFDEYEKGDIIECYQLEKIPQSL